MNSDSRICPPLFRGENIERKREIKNKGLNPSKRRKEGKREREGN